MWDEEDCGIYIYYSDDNTATGNNCSDNGWGIYLDSSSRSIISDNICLENYEGISLYDSSSAFISGNNCSRNQYGMSIVSSSGNQITDNQLVDNSQYGVYLVSGSDSNTVWNCTFIRNNGASNSYDPSRIQAYDDGTYDQWNSVDCYGNWWADWSIPLDADRDGVLDQPYPIAGSAGAMDYYPYAPESRPHSPIYITSNVQFALRAMVEGWSGDGSSGNPYVISWYDIASSSMNGIQIKNTDVYFVISNVVITSKSHTYKGISLTNVANGRIENTICMDDAHGIYATLCSNLEIVRCNASSNSGNGIYVLSSNGVVLNDCDAYSNGNHGIHLSSCTNLMMNDVDASANNWDGIYARLCSSMGWGDCDFDNNGLYGAYLSGCTASTISGGGGGGGGASYNAKSGYLLAVCDGIDVTSVTATGNVWYGLHLITSTGITYSGCDFTGNSRGEVLGGSGPI